MDHLFKITKKNNSENQHNTSFIYCISLANSTKIQQHFKHVKKSNVKRYWGFFKTSLEIMSTHLRFCKARKMRVLGF